VPDRLGGRDGEQQQERHGVRRGVGHHHRGVRRLGADRDRDPGQQPADGEPHVAERPEEAEPLLPLARDRDGRDDVAVGAPEGGAPDGHHHRPRGDRDERVGDQVGREPDALEDVAGQQHALGADPVDHRADQRPGGQRDQARQRDRGADLHEGEVGRDQEVEHRDRHEHAAPDRVDADRRDEAAVAADGREAQAVQHRSIVRPHVGLRASGYRPR
jgi:hypothetical protein